MTDKREQSIAVLVNKGLDGDMDAVNACEDRMIRSKAKAMIVKVEKGTVERPAMPDSSSTNFESDKPADLNSLPIDDQISILVNKGLDGDMDSVNACEDRMIRSKAKAMIVKVKSGTVERPAIPENFNLDGFFLRNF